MTAGTGAAIFAEVDEIAGAGRGAAGFVATPGKGGILVDACIAVVPVGITGEVPTG